MKQWFAKLQPFTTSQRTNFYMWTLLLVPTLGAELAVLYLKNLEVMTSDHRVQSLHCGLEPAEAKAP